MWPAPSLIPGTIGILIMIGLPRSARRFQVLKNRVVGDARVLGVGLGIKMLKVEENQVSRFSNPFKVIPLGASIRFKSGNGWPRRLSSCSSMRGKPRLG